MTQPDHVRKRETSLGRWLPVSLYSLNFVLWSVTGISAQAWDLLWLAALALPAVGFYLLRTHKG